MLPVTINHQHHHHLTVKYRAQWPVTVSFHRLQGLPVDLFPFG
jgi:hypothetical protein